MAMSVLGYTLADLREIAPLVGATVVVGGVVYRTTKTALDRYYNREFDQWLVSVTSVTAADAAGNRRLILDNLGSPERFDDAVRGRDERAWMRRAANHCSWEPERRFLLANEQHGRAILHVTRNALTKYWQDGLRAKMAGVPVVEQEIYFAVTGADAAVGAKKKYRVIVMTAADMLAVLEHPKDKWLVDDETHYVRLETCRIMANAWLRHGKEFSGAPRDPTVAGSVFVDDERHAIVGWMRVYHPAGMMPNPLVA